MRNVRTCIWPRKVEGGELPGLNLRKSVTIFVFKLHYRFVRDIMMRDDNDITNSKRG